MIENDPFTPSPQVKQTMLMIWASLVMSQVLLIVVVYFVQPHLLTTEFTQPIWGPTPATTGGFAVASVILLVLSFKFKQRFFARAAAEKDASLYQTGLIIACAMCEGVSLFGLTLALGFEYQYFLIWNIAGIIGTLLHFPSDASLRVR